MDPDGNIVATSVEAWDLIVIPQVLADYSERKKSEIDNSILHSFVVGFDFYHYNKNYWCHGWGNLMPYHYDDGGKYNYHKYAGEQWLDYSGGVILGAKINKHLGLFAEGKYNKYWNREWYDFKFGVNYVIF